jgi:ABC-type transporter Mla MlaB component
MMTQDVASDGRLVLEGALTMRTAEALCTTLREAIAQHTGLAIDCTAATEVDLSCIQLLIAARTSALEADKIVAFAAPPDGVLLDTLTRAGFRVTHEDRSGEAQAFWFEGAAT